MNRIFFTFSLLIIFSLLSCDNPAPIQKNDALYHSELPYLRPGYAVSPDCISFLRAIKQQAGDRKLESITFKPAFLKEHNLTEKSGIIYVNGFAKKDVTFEQAEFDRMQIITSPGMGNLASVQIPIQSLNDFLQYRGITFFQMAQKVSPK